MAGCTELPACNSGGGIQAGGYPALRQAPCGDLVQLLEQHVTTTYERKRAVNWGADLLDRISRDAAVPATLVARANEITLTYPKAHALEDWLRSGAVNLTSEWGEALSSALCLFQEMQTGGLGSPATREHLRFTLRHFPQEWMIPRMCQASWLGWWLQPDC